MVANPGIKKLYNNEWNSKEEKHVESKNSKKKKKTAMWGCLTFFWFNLFFYLKK